MRFLLIPLLTLGLSLGFSTPLQLEQGDQLNALAPTAPHLVTNNRPLIKVNGKTISLMDVVKKMDIIIHEYYPEVSNSVVSLFQFYSGQWKQILEDLVFNELMILDAEQKEIKVSDGDVREEMERRFGPNIIVTLAKLKLQYDEVRQMIHDEIIVRKIQGMKVYSKVQLTVTPELIKSSYTKYLEDNPPKEEWKYQVLSVRGENSENCLSIVNKISEKLRLENTKLSELTKNMSETLEDNTLKLSLSKDYIVTNTSIAKEHKKVLETLNENDYSPPIVQTSRVNNTPVYRIFHLKSHNLKNPSSFDDMYDNIYNRLLDHYAKIERRNYLVRLGKKFGFDEGIIKEATSDDYQPFALR